MDDFIRKVFGTDVLQDLYNLTQYTALWFGMISSLCIFVKCGMVKRDQSSSIGMG